jgi:hypothetical protein
VLEITFINVGYGEGILVEYIIEGFSRNRPFVLLIDGGSAGDEEYKGGNTGRIRTVEYLPARGITIKEFWAGCVISKKAARF